MATGTDWLLGAVANFAGIKPDDLKRNLADLGQITVGLKSQLDRIEANQKVILAAVAPQHQENYSGEYSLHSNGSAEKGVGGSPSG